MNTHPLNKKVGESIEQYRLRSRKNIKQMASLLQLSETGYRNIERGITEVGLLKLFKIAEILNVSVPDLLCVTEESTEKIPGQNLSTPNSTDSIYRLCLEQYKAENQFLKKQLYITKNLLSKALRL